MTVNIDFIRCDGCFHFCVIGMTNQQFETLSKVPDICVEKRLFERKIRELTQKRENILKLKEEQQEFLRFQREIVEMKLQLENLIPKSYTTISSGWSNTHIDEKLEVRRLRTGIHYRKRKILEYQRKHLL